MVVQWLRFDASNAEDVGLIPCWVTKIAHGLECSQKFQKKKKTWKVDGEALTYI